MIRKEIEKKIVFIDMDGVITDFLKGVDDYWSRHHNRFKKYTEPDGIHGLFRDLPEIEGAVEAIHKLARSGKFELYIATTAPWGNPEAATDKRYWIENHFGELFHKRLTITHNKELLYGDYLIDDRLKNGAGEFRGKLLHFGSTEFPNWESILNYLLNEKN